MPYRQVHYQFVNQNERRLRSPSYDWVVFMNNSVTREQTLADLEGAGWRLLTSVTFEGNDPFMTDTFYKE